MKDDQKVKVRELLIKEIENIVEEKTTTDAHNSLPAVVMVLIEFEKAIL